MAARNGAVILAGPPVNLLPMIARPDGREWVTTKARVLSIAAGRFASGTPDPIVAADVAGFRKLLAEWPSPIVMAGTELNDAVRLPGRELQTGTAWAERHPVVDAYRAYGRHHQIAGDFDVPSRWQPCCTRSRRTRATSSGRRQAVITVADDGTTRFTASPSGRHHYLIAKADQKQRVLDTCVKLVTAQPPRLTRPAPKPTAHLRTLGATASALVTIVAVLALGLTMGQPAHLAGQADEFDAAVRPVLTGTCSTCHNPQVLSGGLNVADLATPASLARDRDAWEGAACA